MDAPLVSVIMPFYSNVVWLKEAVDSVLQQTYPNLELILVNDGSKEDISGFLKDYNNKLIYIKKENGGPASARNTGINRATGKYIAFLDSDDIWIKEKVQKQVEYMQEKRYVWSHTAYTRFGKNICSSTVDLNWFRNLVFPIVISSCPIATPCVMIQTSILKEVNDLRFATDMKAGEDTYFWLRLSLKYELGYIEQSLTKVRMRGKNSALSAFAQLCAKAQLYQHIKQENLFDSKQKLNGLVRFSLQWCRRCYKILQKSKGNNSIIEFLSKIMYLFPWFFFKIQKWAYKVKNKGILE